MLYLMKFFSDTSWSIVQNQLKGSTQEKASFRTTKNLKKVDKINKCTVNAKNKVLKSY